MASSNRIPRELNESIRNALGGKGVKVTLKCPVRLETKGDKAENKVLVFTAWRIYVIAAKIPSKIDAQFNYLDISVIESKKQSQLCLTVGDRVYSFQSLEPDSNDVDIMIVHIGTMLRNVFPSVSLEEIIRRIDVVAPQRIQALFENNTSSSTKDVGPCGGFSKQYQFTCDYHGLPYREEVAWDVDTIYLSHDTKELCLHDFDHLESRDLVPIIAALEYNRWFKKLRASNIKLNSEACEQILNVMKKNSSIEELYFDNTGIKGDFAHKLSLSLIANSRTSLHTIDISNNLIEDKGISSLCGIVAKITQGANHIAKAASSTSKGIVHLNLAKTSLTSKGVNTLTHALSVNKFMPSTLTFLNLADNILKDEVSNLYNFLAQPNSLTHLDLSGTECSTDMLFGALLRGCCQKLSHINMSRNAFLHKKGKDPIVPPSFKQFFSTTLGLKYLNVSFTKIPVEALKNLMLGLACNESACDVELDLSNNVLGTQGAHVIETCVPEMKCLSSLDISENNLEGELGSVITAISKNKSIRRLCIAKNFVNTKAKHVSHAMEALVQMIQEEDCMLEYLSLADSRLKTDMFSLINALGSNQCLVTIDLSGNQIGDGGARLLAKALQINNKLRALIYDKNSITGQGFHDLAYAMESNYSVCYMPFPLHDAMLAMKSAPEKTEVALKKIENLLHRNVSPKKYSNGQAFRLQQGFLLSSTQQMVDKLVVQTQDTATVLKQVPGDAYKETLDDAAGIIQDANNAKQLLTRFHEVVLQREETGNPVDQKIASLTQELSSTVEQHLQGTMASLMLCAEEQCPNILKDERIKQNLEMACKEKIVLPKDFVKQCMSDGAGADITNKVNELHLAVASQLSDRIIDQVVDCLTRTYKSLLTSSHKRRSMTPETQRNRVRTDSSSSKGESVCDNSETSGSPRATPQLSSKRKTVHHRKLRPQSVVDEDTIVELPGSDQKLEHLVKDRPKRAKTRAPTRPALNSSVLLADQDLNEGLDNFFHKRISESSLNSLPSSSLDNKSSLPSLSSISECPKSESTYILDKSSKESLISKDKQSPDSEPVKKDSFREKNSKSFIKGLNNVFGRSNQDKFQRSKSMDQDRAINNQVKPDETVVAPTELTAIEAKVVPKVNLRKPVGLERQVMANDVLAEMKARQEKRMSTVLLTKGDATNLDSSLVDSNLVQSSEAQPMLPVTSTAHPENTPKVVLPTLSDTKSHTGSSGGTKIRTDAENAGSSPPTEKPSLQPRFRPPPIAPKPRPRSVIGNDIRKSGEFSPHGDGDLSSVDSPTGIDKDDDTDSGLVGSRDSLSQKLEAGEDYDDDGTSVDEVSPQKSSSLPRTVSSIQEPADEITLGASKKRFSPTTTCRDNISNTSAAVDTCSKMSVVTSGSAKLVLKPNQPVPKDSIVSRLPNVESVQDGLDDVINV